MWDTAGTTFSPHVPEILPLAYAVDKGLKHGTLPMEYKIYTRLHDIGVNYSGRGEKCAPHLGRLVGSLSLLRRIDLDSEQWSGSSVIIELRKLRRWDRRYHSSSARIAVDEYRINTEYRIHTRWDLELD